jgi:DNA-binding MarR family transcriptional regulator
MNKQISLKPQDVLVLAKLICHPRRSFTYAQLGEQLGIAASEAHASIKRAMAARLISVTEEGMQVSRESLREFLIHGAKYAFPAVTGPVTRGVSTSYAAPPLREAINQPDELPPVWPSPEGNVRGVALYPLYPTVPEASLKDPRLYECLALLDALRSGAAREREMAEQILTERI